MFVDTQIYNHLHLTWCDCTTELWAEINLCAKTVSDKAQEFRRLGGHEEIPSD